MQSKLESKSLISIRIYNFDWCYCKNLWNTERKENLLVPLTCQNRSFIKINSDGGYRWTTQQPHWILFLSFPLPRYHWWHGEPISSSPSPPCGSDQPPPLQNLLSPVEHGGGLPQALHPISIRTHHRSTMPTNGFRCPHPLDQDNHRWASMPKFPHPPSLEKKEHHTNI